MQRITGVTLPATHLLQLTTANCLAYLPTAYCQLPTAYLPTAYCLLPTAYCLLPTVHLRSMTTTVSMCAVCGNMSTGWMRSKRYPAAGTFARSRAIASGLQDT
jgi:hypothetical protein